MSQSRLKALATRLRVGVPANAYRGGWVDTFRGTVLTQLLANVNQQGSSAGWTYIDYTAGPDKWDISKSVRRQWGINPVFDYGRAMSVLRHKDERVFMGHPFLGLMRRVREVNSEVQEELVLNPHKRGTKAMRDATISKLVPGFKYFPSTAALLKPVMRPQDRAILCEKDPEYFHRLANYVGEDHRFKLYNVDVFEEIAMRDYEKVGQNAFREQISIPQRMARGEKLLETYYAAVKQQNREAMALAKAEPVWVDPRTVPPPKLSPDSDLARFTAEAEENLRKGVSIPPAHEEFKAEMKASSKQANDILKYLGLLPVDAPKAAPLPQITESGPEFVEAVPPIAPAKPVPLLEPRREEYRSDDEYKLALRIHALQRRIREQEALAHYKVQGVNMEALPAEIKNNIGEQQLRDPEGLAAKMQEAAAKATPESADRLDVRRTLVVLQAQLSHLESAGAWTEDLRVLWEALHKRIHVAQNTIHAPLEARALEDEEELTTFEQSAREESWEDHALERDADNLNLIELGGEDIHTETLYNSFQAKLKQAEAAHQARCRQLQDRITFLQEQQKRDMAEISKQKPLRITEALQIADLRALRKRVESGDATAMKEAVALQKRFASEYPAKVAPAIEESRVPAELPILLDTTPKGVLQMLDRTLIDVADLPAAYQDAERPKEHPKVVADREAKAAEFDKLKSLTNAYLKEKAAGASLDELTIKAVNRAPTMDAVRAAAVARVSASMDTENKYTEEVLSYIKSQIELWSPKIEEISSEEEHKEHISQLNKMAEAVVAASRPLIAQRSKIVEAAKASGKEDGPEVASARAALLSAEKSFASKLAPLRSLLLSLQSSVIESVGMEMSSSESHLKDATEALTMLQETLEEAKEVKEQLEERLDELEAIADDAEEDDEGRVLSGGLSVAQEEEMEKLVQIEERFEQLEQTQNFYASDEAVELVRQEEAAAASAPREEAPEVELTEAEKAEAALLQADAEEQERRMIADEEAESRAQAEEAAAEAAEEAEMAQERAEKAEEDAKAKADVADAAETAVAKTVAKSPVSSEPVDPVLAAAVAAEAAALTGPVETDLTKLDPEQHLRRLAKLEVELHEAIATAAEIEHRISTLKADRIKLGEQSFQLPPRPEMLKEADKQPMNEARRAVRLRTERALLMKRRLALRKEIQRDKDEFDSVLLMTDELAAAHILIESQIALMEKRMERIDMELSEDPAVKRQLAKLQAAETPAPSLEFDRMAEQMGLAEFQQAATVAENRLHALEDKLGPRAVMEYERWNEDELARQANKQDRATERYEAQLAGKDIEVEELEDHETELPDTLQYPVAIDARDITEAQEIKYLEEAGIIDENGQLAEDEEEEDDEGLSPEQAEIRAQVRAKLAKRLENPAPRDEANEEEDDVERLNEDDDAISLDRPSAGTVELPFASTYRNLERKRLVAQQRANRIAIVKAGVDPDDAKAVWEYMHGKPEAEPLPDPEDDPEAIEEALKQREIEEDEEEANDLELQAEREAYRKELLGPRQHTDVPLIDEDPERPGLSLPYDVDEGDVNDEWYDELEDEIVEEEEDDAKDEAAAFAKKAAREDKEDGDDADADDVAEKKESEDDKPVDESRYDRAHEDEDEDFNRGDEPDETGGDAVQGEDGEPRRKGVQSDAVVEGVDDVDLDLDDLDGEAQPVSLRETVLKEQREDDIDFYGGEAEADVQALRRRAAAIEYHLTGSHPLIDNADDTEPYVEPAFALSPAELVAKAKDIASLRQMAQAAGEGSAFAIQRLEQMGVPVEVAAAGETGMPVEAVFPDTTEDEFALDPVLARLPTEEFQELEADFDDANDNAHWRDEVREETELIKRWMRLNPDEEGDLSDPDFRERVLNEIEMEPEEYMTQQEVDELETELAVTSPEVGKPLHLTKQVWDAPEGKYEEEEGIDAENEDADEDEDEDDDEFDRYDEHDELDELDERDEADPYGEGGEGGEDGEDGEDGDDVDPSRDVSLTASRHWTPDTDLALVRKFHELTPVGRREKARLEAFQAWQTARKQALADGSLSAKQVALIDRKLIEIDEQIEAIENAHIKIPALDRLEAAVETQAPVTNAVPALDEPASAAGSASAVPAVAVASAAASTPAMVAAPVTSASAVVPASVPASTSLALPSASAMQRAGQALSAYLAHRLPSKPSVFPSVAPVKAAAAPPAVSMPRAGTPLGPTRLEVLNKHHPNWQRELSTLYAEEDADEKKQAQDAAKVKLLHPNNFALQRQAAQSMASSRSRLAIEQVKKLMSQPGRNAQYKQMSERRIELINEMGYFAWRAHTREEKRRKIFAPADAHADPRRTIKIDVPALNAAEAPKALAQPQQQKAPATAAEIAAQVQQALLKAQEVEPERTLLKHESEAESTARLTKQRDEALAALETRLQSVQADPAVIESERVFARLAIEDEFRRAMKQARVLRTPAGRLAVLHKELMSLVQVWSPLDREAVNAQAAEIGQPRALEESETEEAVTQRYAARIQLAEERRDAATTPEERSRLDAVIGQLLLEFEASTGPQEDVEQLDRQEDELLQEIEDEEELEEELAETGEEPELTDEQVHSNKQALAEMERERLLKKQWDPRDVAAIEQLDLQLAEMYYQRELAKQQIKAEAEGLLELVDDDGALPIFSDFPLTPQDMARELMGPAPQKLPSVEAPPLEIPIVDKERVIYAVDPERVPAELAELHALRTAASEAKGAAEMLETTIRQTLADRAVGSADWHDDELAALHRAEAELSEKLKQQEALLEKATPEVRAATLRKLAAAAEAAMEFHADDIPKPLRDEEADIEAALRGNQPEDAEQETGAVVAAEDTEDVFEDIDPELAEEEKEVEESREIILRDLSPKDRALVIESGLLPKTYAERVAAGEEEPPAVEADPPQVVQEMELLANIEATESGLKARIMELDPLAFIDRQTRMLESQLSEQQRVLSNEQRAEREKVVAAWRASEEKEDARVVAAVTKNPADPSVSLAQAEMTVYRRRAQGLDVSMLLPVVRRLQEAEEGVAFKEARRILSADDAEMTELRKHAEGLKPVLPLGASKQQIENYEANLESFVEDIAEAKAEIKRAREAKLRPLALKLMREWKAARDPVESRRRQLLLSIEKASMTPLLEKAEQLRAQSQSSNMSADESAQIARDLKAVESRLELLETPSIDDMRVQLDALLTQQEDLAASLPKGLKWIQQSDDLAGRKLAEKRRAEEEARLKKIEEEMVLEGEMPLPENASAADRDAWLTKRVTRAYARIVEKTHMFDKLNEVGADPSTYDERRQELEVQCWDAARIEVLNETASDDVLVVPAPEDISRMAEAAKQDQLWKIVPKEQSLKPSSASTHFPVNLASAFAKPLTSHAIIGIDIAEAITEGYGFEGDILSVDDLVLAATSQILEQSVHRFPQATYVITYPIFGRGYQDQLLKACMKTGVRSIIQATFHIQKGEPFDTAARVYDFEPWGAGVVVIRPPPGFDKVLKDIVNTMQDVMVAYGPSVHSSEEAAAVASRSFPPVDAQANATFFVDQSIHWQDGWPNRPDVSWMTAQLDEHIKNLHSFRWEHFVPSFENQRSKRFELLARARTDMESDLWNYSRGYRGDDETANKWLLVNNKAGAGAALGKPHEGTRLNQPPSVATPQVAQATKALAAADAEKADAKRAMVRRKEALIADKLRLEQVVPTDAPKREERVSTVAVQLEAARARLAALPEKQAATLASVKGYGEAKAKAVQLVQAKLAMTRSKLELRVAKLSESWERLQTRMTSDELASAKARIESALDSIPAAFEQLETEHSTRKAKLQQARDRELERQAAAQSGLRKPVDMGHGRRGTPIAAHIPSPRHTKSEDTRVIDSVDQGFVLAQQRALRRLSDEKLAAERNAKRTQVFEMLANFQKGKLGQVTEAAEEAAREAERIAQAKRDGTWTEEADDADRSDAGRRRRQPRLHQQMAKDTHFQSLLAKHNQKTHPQNVLPNSK